MIDLDAIMKMWEKDSRIDGMALDDASLDAIKAHAKYLEILSVTKLQKKRKEHEQKKLLLDKWIYYSGKMDKAEIDKRGWPYDPFNGMHVMKADLPKYFEADADLQKSEETIVYLTTTIETLEEIIGTLRWRHQSIKNMIEHRKFVSGG